MQSAIPMLDSGLTLSWPQVVICLLINYQPEECRFNVSSWSEESRDNSETMMNHPGFCIIHEWVLKTIIMTYSCINFPNIYFLLEQLFPLIFSLQIRSFGPIDASLLVVRCMASNQLS